MYRLETDQIIGLSHLSVGTIDAPDGLTHDKIAPCIIIAQTIEGRYEVELNGQTRLIAPGEAFCAPTDVPLHIVHRARRGQAIMRARWMHVQFRLWDTVDLSAWLEMPLRLTRKQTAPLGRIIQQLLDMPAITDAPWPLDRLSAAHHLAYQALEHLCELCPMRPEAGRHLAAIGRLEPMFIYIRTHLNRHIEVESLAETTGVSTSLLHALCRQLLDCTPMQYVRQVRLSEARRRLIATSDSIADIAENVGFPNAFHFSRTFSRAFGRSASDYRRDHQLWRRATS